MIFYRSLYYMLRTFARNNITLVSIIIFIAVFGFVQVMQPAFLYKRDGSIREFGVGYKNKTIMPVWLFSIILGILSYLFVLYYISFPRLH
jgi:hypothetical protein